MWLSGHTDAMAVADTARRAVADLNEAGSSYVRQLRGTRLGRAGLLGPAFVLIAALMIVPTLILIGFSFNPFVNGEVVPGFTLEHYRRALLEPFYRGVLVRTIRVAAVVTLLTFLLGFPLAYAAVRAGGWVGKLIVVATLAPLTIDLVVRSFGWFILLSRNGLVNSTLVALGLVPAGDVPQLLFNELAIVIGLTHVMLPFMVFPLISVIHTIPRSYEEAAANLGANRLTTFRTVVFPLALPGITAGVLITFIVTMASYVTPAILGGDVKVIPVVITDTFTSTSNWPFASALSMILVVVATVVIVGYQRVIVRLDEAGGI
jgi:ABC-type spermidine/putrescine transport system permease subunit I